MSTPSTPTNNTVGLYRTLLNEHPYSWDMLAELNQYGIPGLLHPDPLINNDLRRQKRNSNDFANYQPTGFIGGNLPLTEFDFSHEGTYSIYNWEIFFHSVSLIARQMRTNGQYAGAIRWLSYIFDPTCPDEPSPNQLYDLRFWQIKPFVINVTQGSIQNMIRLLSQNNLTFQEQQMRDEFVAQIAAWRKHPFDPHIIAQMRPRAYMLWTVMEYVTTLCDWGDSLFRQDTMESINEAINLYIMAQEILGPRPRQIERPTPDPVCFNDIMNNLSAFSDVMVAFENRMTGMNLGYCPANGIQNGRGLSCAGSSSGSQSIPDLLFCVPDNPNLVALWDRVEDRLFKIRHCMNIDGKKRELALFAPPIDPAMLVQAAAAGISIESALADLSKPLPHYRFTYLLQKANEFCNEVKALGSQLLSLLEKKDAEELALFRQVHEQNILKASRAIKEMAIKEAKQSKATLESSKNLIQIRLDDYNNRQFRNSKEEKAQEMTATTDGLMYAEQGIKMLAALVTPIPEFKLNTFAGTLTGIGSDLRIVDGKSLASALNYGASALSLTSSVLRNKASQALTFASYQRREEEWNLQKKMATEELLQVDRQLLGADIRIAVTEKELSNHDLQIDQSNEMTDWLKNKYTNKNLYQWMLGQVKIVYRTAFDLAYNMAKNAQVCYEYELGISAPNMIQYGQWDSTKSGLLAGEKLAVQLKQLENAFIENNARELELSKNISLALLDPLALQELKINGSCTFEIPDVLFNIDYPGHYFRRIKAISLSIPCIAGPQTNINATLSLTHHKIRTSDQDTSEISSTDLEFIPVESIATSSAQNDGGVFELNLRDERYLPFEGRGCASRWTLELSDAKKQFDYETLSDVVVHMKYTARDAGSGSDLADAMSGNIAAYLNDIKQGLSATDHFHYALSLRHDMPNEWYEFKQNGSTDITLLTRRLPYFIQLLGVAITDLTVVAFTDLSSPPGTKSIKIKPTPSGTLTSYTLNLISATSIYKNLISSLGLSFGTAMTIAEGTGTGGLNKADVTDIVLAVKLNLT